MTASDRRTLLDLIVQVIGDSSSSRESGKVITRRYNDGPAYSAEHGNHRLSSRERTSPKSSSKRPSGKSSAHWDPRMPLLCHHHLLFFVITP